MKLNLPLFFDEKLKQEFVLSCEKGFEEQLDQLTKNILSSKDLKVILLSGPSCAGKTTTVRKIREDAEKIGKTVVSVSIDDFYKDRAVYEEECIARGQKVNLEIADAIDIDCLEECISKIFNEKTAFMPVFDFKTGRRSSLRPYRIEKNHILMFEGIQVVYEEFKRFFEKFAFKLVFIDAFEPLETPYWFFSGRDLRLARRLVRDFYRRGASAEKTFSLWKQVVENEDRSIYPNLDIVDCKISSTMAYEPMMMKKHLLKVLGSVKPEEACYLTAHKILSRYTFFPEISEKYLPKDSVYHEFL